MTKSASSLIQACLKSANANGHRASLEIRPEVTFTNLWQAYQTALCPSLTTMAWLEKRVTSEIWDGTNGEA